MLLRSFVSLLVYSKRIQEATPYPNITISIKSIVCEVPVGYKIWRADNKSMMSSTVNIDPVIRAAFLLIGTLAKRLDFFKVHFSTGLRRAS